RTLAAGVRLRRAGGDLCSAESLDQLFTSLEAMLATYEFDRVELEAGDVFRTWERERQGDKETRRQGAWGRLSWMLRVPLTDERGEALGAITFYRLLGKEISAIDLERLCGSLQHELSVALARLLGEGVKG
ncbi:MAG: hypothetical protein ACREVM_06590, partial [Burkholderiales bacterium]